MLSAVCRGIHLSPHSHVCKTKPDRNKVSRLVCSVMAAITCIETNTLSCASQGCFPLPSCSSDQHTQRVPSGLRAQI